MKDRAPGRKREAAQIRVANRSAAVGRLMLGKLGSWEEFISADSSDLAALPRWQLKSGVKDVKSRLQPEIRAFCRRNFRGMTGKKLSALYEDIKAFRGLELPLNEFEGKYATVNPQVVAGNPAHLTISIGLFGLQFRFPEHYLANDLAESVGSLATTQTALTKYERLSHAEICLHQAEIQQLLRRQGFAARAGLLACFNLIEAYLNGLAWDFLQSNDISLLSKKRRKLLEDSTGASIRDKLLKYPEIIAGRALWDDSDLEVDAFLRTIKPFRDSLVHPSPFSAPAKFGGYDKLRLLYRIGPDTVQVAASTSVKLIERMHNHIHTGVECPPWIQDTRASIDGRPREQQISEQDVGGKRD